MGRPSSLITQRDEHRLCPASGDQRTLACVGRYTRLPPGPGSRQAPLRELALVVGFSVAVDRGKR